MASHGLSPTQCVDGADTRELPPELVEYVVIHELCHLIEHNHTPSFWSLVRRADRDFERKERWLRENGRRFDL